MRTLQGQPPPLQPWAQALYDQRARDADMGKAFADAASRCLPNGTPFAMYDAGFGIQIIQSPGQVTVLFEEQRTYRIIAINGKHPEDPDPSFFGHSIGEYRGDTLVVDTIGLNAITTLDKLGLPHTEQLRVNEQIRRPEPDLLEIVFTFTDPGAFTQPWSIRRTYSRWPAGQEILEYVCQENQQNSADEQGNSRFRN